MAGAGRTDSDPDAAQEWAARLGDQDDDLAPVLRHVRVNRLPATRAAWANAWQTREFLNLGLMLLRDHQVKQSELAPGEGMRLSSALTPENLANIAQITIADPERAAALSVVRWKETWGHQAAYTEDLIAYLYRPAPYRRRIDALRDAVLVQGPPIPFGTFITAVTSAVFTSAAEDPLINIQSWIQAAIPQHPSLLAHADVLDVASREIWTILLDKLMAGYGLTLIEDYTPTDMAILLRSTIAGLLLVRKADTDQLQLSDGLPVLAANAMAVASAFCGVPLPELRERLPPG